MQSTTTFSAGQPRPRRDAMLSWFQAAVWVVFAGAMSPPALAQASADPTDGEKTEAPSEPEGAAAPEAAPRSEPQSEPDRPTSWNRPRTAPTGVDGQLRRLTADLKLDASQQAKVRPILVARNEDLQRLQRDTQLTPAQRRERTLALGDRSAEQIRALLTDAQRAQFVGPRGATPVAQAGTTGRRRGAAASTAAPVKGAVQ
jgi:hypothetical protein